MWIVEQHQLINYNKIRIQTLQCHLNKEQSVVTKTMNPLEGETMQPQYNVLC